MSAQEDFTASTPKHKPNLQQYPVTFKITTPLFYTQIARCTSISECIKTALSNPDTQTATFYTSHPDLVIQLFKNTPSADVILKMQPRSKVALADRKAISSDTTSFAPCSLLNSIRWIPIRFLRRFQSPHDRHSLSDLDAYAVGRSSTANAPQARAYRKAVFKILLSDYVAYGVPAVIDAALWIIRIWLCWLSVRSFDGLVELCGERGRLGGMEIGKILVGCLGVHAWWGLGELL